MVSTMLYWLTPGILSTRGYDLGNSKENEIGVQEEGKNENKVTIYQNLCKTKRNTIILMFVTRVLLWEEKNLSLYKEIF